MVWRLDTKSLSSVVRASFIWTHPVQISLLSGPVSGSHDPDPSSLYEWWLLPDFTSNTLRPLILSLHILTLCAAIPWLWYSGLWCLINYFWRYRHVSWNAFSFAFKALAMRSTISTFGSFLLGIRNNYYNILLYKHTISYVPSYMFSLFPSSSVPWWLWTVSLSSDLKISRLRDSWHNGVGVNAACNVSPTVTFGEDSRLRVCTSRYLRRHAALVALKSKDTSAAVELFSLSGRGLRWRLFGVISNRLYIETLPTSRTLETLLVESSATYVNQ